MYTYNHIHLYMYTYIIGIHPYIRWNDVYVPYTAAQAPWLQSVAKSLLPGSDAYIPVKLGAKDAKDVVSGDPKETHLHVKIDWEIDVEKLDSEW